MRRGSLLGWRLVFALAAIGNAQGDPVLTIDSPTLVETQTGTSEMVFTASLSEPSAGTVTARYRTFDIDGRAGEDFEAAEGDLVFAPGETTKSIPIRIFGDTVSEADERFGVVLEEATGATIEASWAPVADIDTGLHEVEGIVIHGNQVFVNQLDYVDQPSVSIYEKGFGAQGSWGLRGGFERPESFLAVRSPHTALAVTEDFLAIGYYIGHTGAFTASVVQIYRRDLGAPLGWTLAGQLDSDIVADGRGFGSKLAFVGDDLLVGAPWLDDDNHRPGRVHCYRGNPDGSDWQLYQVIERTGWINRWLGSEIAALAPDEIVIGKQSRLWIHRFDQVEGLWDEGQIVNLDGPDPTVGSQVSAGYGAGCFTVGSTRRNQDGEWWIPATEIYERDLSSSNGWRQVEEFNLGGTASGYNHYITEDLYILALRHYVDNGHFVSRGLFSEVNIRTKRDGWATETPLPSPAWLASTTTSFPSIRNLGRHLSVDRGTIAAGYWSHPSEGNRARIALYRQTAGIGTIVSDDPLQISIEDRAGNEGNRHGFQINFSYPVREPVQIWAERIIASPEFQGTATRDDFVGGDTETIEVGPGYNGAKIYFETREDLHIEDDETFAVRISAPGQDVEFIDDFAIGTILNDDVPQLRVTTPYYVSEGDTREITITSSLAHTEPITVDYRTVDGTAKAGEDYVPISGTLVFQPGEQSTTILLSTIDDPTPEENELLYIELANPSIGETFDGEVKIQSNNDPWPTVRAEDITVLEADALERNATFTLSIADPMPLDLSFDYRVVGLDASIPGDAAPVSGRLTIPGGQTTATVQVPVYGDRVAEPDERFQLLLSNFHRASYGTIPGDPTPRHSHFSPSAGQGGNYGEALAFRGDWLLVGEPDTGAGVVHVHHRNSGGPRGWGAVGRLEPSAGADGDRFGSALDFDGQTLIVGAPGRQGGAGRVSLYTLQDELGGVLQLVRQLDGESAGDELGATVAIDSELATTSAPGEDDGKGAIYVFAESPTPPGWEPPARIAGASVSPTGSAVGAGLDIHAGTIVATSSDRVTLLRQGGGGWGVVGSVPEPEREFVSLQGDVLAVVNRGVLSEDNRSLIEAGLLNIYQRAPEAPGTFELLQSITPGQGTIGNGYYVFGHSLAHTGNRIAVGWDIDTFVIIGNFEGQIRTGQVSIFHSGGGAGGEWEQTITVRVDKPRENLLLQDLFGRGLAMRDGELFVGATGEDFYGQNRGAFYAYTWGDGPVATIIDNDRDTPSLRRLISSAMPRRVAVPENDALGDSWLAPQFDDSTWLEGAGPVGYESDSGYEALIGLDVGTLMAGQNQTAYIRFPFPGIPSEELRALQLHIRYDDGFIAYLNGSKIAERNPAADPGWNSGAAGSHDDAEAILFEKIDVTGSIDRLDATHNVLAVHGLNYGLESSDFLIDLELVGLVQHSYTPAPYETWMTAFPSVPQGLAGLSRDADSDGSMNVFEYICGSDPTRPGRPLGLHVVVDDGSFQVEFELASPLPADSVVELQSNTHLGSGWQSIASRTGQGGWTGPATVEETQGAGAKTVVTVTIPASMVAGQPRVLFRLKGSLSLGD